MDLPLLITSNKACEKSAMVHAVEQGEIEGTTLFFSFFFCFYGNDIVSEVNSAQHSFGCPMFHRFFFFFFKVGSWVMDYFIH
jgi:hypothetical protein